MFEQPSKLKKSATDGHSKQGLQKATNFYGHFLKFHKKMTSFFTLILVIFSFFNDSNGYFSSYNSWVSFFYKAMIAIRMF